jgi:hypothetical protein
MEYRGEILHLFRLFIQRIRSSTHSAKKGLTSNGIEEVLARRLESTIDKAQVFLEWLISFCRQCIQPGRTYYTACMSLKVILCLCEEDIFSDLNPEIKTTGVSGVHIELFSPGTVRLLINRLADGYDEVARMAFQLLEMVKDTNVISWMELYENGKKLCLNGRVDRSEGGAKVLLLCHRFSEVNGISGIWEEVWNSLELDVQSGELRSVATERALHGRLVALRYYHY